MFLLLPKRRAFRFPTFCRSHLLLLSPCGPKISKQDNPSPSRKHTLRRALRPLFCPELFVDNARFPPPGMLNSLVRRTPAFLCASLGLLQKSNVSSLPFPRHSRPSKVATISPCYLFHAPCGICRQQSVRWCPPTIHTFILYSLLLPSSLHRGPVAILPPRNLKSEIVKAMD